MGQVPEVDAEGSWEEKMNKRQKKSYSRKELAFTHREALIPSGSRSSPESE